MGVRSGQDGPRGWFWVFLGVRSSPRGPRIHFILTARLQIRGTCGGMKSIADSRLVARLSGPRGGVFSTADLRGALPSEEMAGIAPRMRASAVKIAEWLEEE